MIKNLKVTFYNLNAAFKPSESGLDSEFNFKDSTPQKSTFNAAYKPGSLGLNACICAQGFTVFINIQSKINRNLFFIYDKKCMFI